MVEESFQRFRFVTGPKDEGRRLDQVLAANIADLSRQKARVLLDRGGVFVDGARTKVASRIVRGGQVIVANIGGGLRRATNAVGEAARARDEAGLPAFRVVHEDSDILVVDKPSGLLTAPTPEGDRGNLAHALGRIYGPVFIVHRIDLETSGLLVFARTDEANRALSERFRDHTIDRAYLAVIRGAVPFEARTVDAQVGGKRAVTHFSLIDRMAGAPAASFVRCQLETGRTHQIRLHALQIGHPVLGDRRYSEPRPGDPPRLALHATRLGFPHPRTGATLAFDSPWPEDLARWLDARRAPP